MKIKRIAFLMLLDSFLINLSFIIAVYIRFETFDFENYLNVYLIHIIVITIINISVFYVFNLYKSLWEYASVDELIEVVMAILVGSLLSILYLGTLNVEMSRAVLIMIVMFNMALIGGVRFSYRILRRLKHHNRRTQDDIRVLIVGAGDAGVMVLNELRNYGTIRFNPIAFIDDDPLKKRRVINRIPVVGNTQDIQAMCKKHKIDEIIIAVPSASKSQRQIIINECSKTKCKTKILPGVYELIDGKVTINQIRDVEITDLLGRDEISLDCFTLNSFISNKTVMVTGGGGSIGSELCRQIASFRPKELIIMDINENTTYNLQIELLKKYKHLSLIVLIGSVRDKARVEEVMSKYKPDIIFHAAAHKHVPLMENSPKDAIKNNVFGTLNLVRAADRHNVKNFIQISTDKAVNPTNVMGATKRMCEKIILAYNSISKTEFVAVRFGNVLGSSGSVIPLFKKQISEGGPVTVTDKEIIRYFMTIPEACQLVLQAGAIAKGGEIFILDMGEPVRIIDLAIHLIKLSGYEPYIDIPIHFTGLRPGEKLFEELLLNKDTVTETSHEKIFVEPPEYIDYNDLILELEELEKGINTLDNIMVKQLLREMGLNYKAAKEII